MLSSHGQGDSEHVLQSALAAPRRSGSELGSESEPPCPQDTETEMIHPGPGLQRRAEESRKVRLLADNIPISHITPVEKQEADLS